MRKLLIFAAVMLLAVISCKKEGPSAEQLAAEAAKTYYTHLQQGEIEQYLSGTADYDSMPAGFQNELRINAKMFLAQQKKEHGGISSVEINSAKADTLLNIIYAMLTIQFGDSTNEEICVPMVEHKGEWKMK